MADEQPPQADAPVVPQVVGPPDSFYKIDDDIPGLEEKNLPYAANNQGLGVNLAPSIHGRVVLATSNFDTVTLNEPENLYAKKILAMVINKMRLKKNTGVVRTPNSNRINRVSERDHFDDVMAAQIYELADEQGHIVEPATHRRLGVIWNVMCGFNDGTIEEENTFNGELHWIAVTYAKICMGVIPYPGDELRAAMHAVQLCYLKKCTDNTVTGKGAWTLPVVHLLNGHLVHGHHATPIAFKPTYKADENCEKNEHENNSRVIYVDGNKIKVESCDSVIRELQGIICDYNGGDLVEILPDQGPPAPPPPPAAEPAPKKPRRSLDLEI